MKNFFEVFMSTIILMLTVLIIVSLFTVETTIIEARNLHSSAIQRLESVQTESGIKAAETAFNEQLQRLHPAKGDYKWEVLYEDVNTQMTGYRQTYLVTLNYFFYIPLFNIVQKGTIQGYAR